LLVRALVHLEGYQFIKQHNTGRIVAGFGVGFVSAIIILYMSEIAPRKVRGTIVSGYQFFITVGILLASGIDQATESKNNASSYRIPIGIQVGITL
jgi:MFS family permease